MLQILGNPLMQEAEFSLAGREYRIEKMKAIPAYKLFMEHVRPCLVVFQDVATQVEVDEAATEQEIEAARKEAMGKVIAAFAKLEYSHLDALWKAFAVECIFIKEEDTGRFVKFTHDPDKLTMGLDPAHLLLITARAFARNFGESAAEFGLGLQEMMGLADSNQNPPTHSSTPESAPNSSPSPI